LILKTEYLLICYTLCHDENYLFTQEGHQTVNLNDISEYNKYSLDESFS